MKRATLQIVLALLAAAPAARAAPDPMAAFYGNTLTIAVPAGYYYARRFIEPDGAWTETRGGSDVIHGKWYVEGDQICHVQTEPAVHNPRRYCYPANAPQHQVGEEWVTTDPDTGNDVIQKIEPSRKPITP